VKNYLTVTETAKHLKLTRQTILYAIKAGKLPAERAGRQWMVKSADIEGAYFINLWDSRGKLLGGIRPEKPVFKGDAVQGPEGTAAVKSE
jgi:excisionase family DNA binding protein